MLEVGEDRETVATSPGLKYSSEAVTSEWTTASGWTEEFLETQNNRTFAGTFTFNETLSTE